MTDGALDLAPVRSRPWTPAEDELLRTRYPDPGQHAALAAELSHRTWGAIVQRVVGLDLPLPGRDWTAAEVDLLRREWGEATPRALSRMFPGRTWRAIASHARVLGLSTIPQGMEPLAVVARRVGYARGTLLKILRAAHVRTMRWQGKRGAKGVTAGGRICRWLLVDALDAEIAVKMHLGFETIRGGAIARGVHVGSMYRELQRTGAYVKGSRGGHRLIPSAALDAASAAIRARSSA